MADANVSQLEINGTTYDICDATARDSLSQYVLKSGDTVTGDIDFESSLIDRNGTPPSEEMILHQWMNFTDKDGDPIGEIAAFQSVTGKTGLRILGIGEYNNNEITNGITFGIEGDGTRTIGITDRLAWQESLNILPSTGGDMTGNLHFKTESMDVTVNPSSDIPSRGIEFQDVNGKRLGYIDMARRSNGRQDLRLVASNETTTGTQVETNLQIQVARDGTSTYSIPSPENFCSAIGRGFSQATSGFTLNSTNISSVGNQLYRKQGRIVYIYVITTTKVSLAAGATKDIGTVPTGYGMSTRPAYLDCSATGTAWIEGTQIRINPSNTIAANTSLAFSGCFII